MRVVIITLADWLRDVTSRNVTLSYDTQKKTKIICIRFIYIHTHWRDFIASKIVNVGRLSIYISGEAKKMGYKYGSHVIGYFG